MLLCLVTSHVKCSGNQSHSVLGGLCKFLESTWLDVKVKESFILKQTIFNGLKQNIKNCKMKIKSFYHSVLIGGPLLLNHQFFLSDNKKSVYQLQAICDNITDT